MIKFSISIFLIIISIYAIISTIYNNIFNKKISIIDKCLNLCLFSSIVFIVSKTFFPIQLNVAFEGFEIYNIIPFKVPIDIYLNSEFSYFIYQVFGNIALFIPFGLFVFLKSKSNLKKSLVLIIFLTLGIEFIQGFIPYRFCEIDDILLNTLGGYIGILISKIINKGHIKALN